MLPAATFAEGPTSGTRLGTGPINGQPVPFADAQPVQGFSAVLDGGDGALLVGRHVGTGQPDDNEFIVIDLDGPLGVEPIE